MIVERCTDLDLIREIMTHPRIYPACSDDGCPPPSEFYPQEHECIYYLTPKNPEVVGVFKYHPINFITYEVHTCVLPAYWGDVAKQAAVSSMCWMFENTDCRKIVTHVPDNNPLALRFTKKCGLSVEGHIKDSILKGGIVYGQTILGITRAELCQQ